LSYFFSQFNLQEFIVEKKYIIKIKIIMKVITTEAQNLLEYLKTIINQQLLHLIKITNQI